MHNGINDKHQLTATKCNTEDNAHHHHRQTYHSVHRQTYISTDAKKEPRMRD